MSKHPRSALHRPLTRLGLLLVLLILASLACDFKIPVDVTPPAKWGSNTYAVLFWKHSENAIDIVFIPDAGYGDLEVIANRQSFYDDVATLITDGFYQNSAFASNIMLFNFWYTHEKGAVTPTSGICPQITAPVFPFAEMRVVIHRSSTVTRDCGGGGVASSRAGSGFEWVIVHESGHAIFDLTDEYCCDGGYSHQPPTLYNSKAGCENDTDNAAWRNCQSFTDKWGNVWWRSEDNTKDLMSWVGPPVLEVGRAEWVLMRQVLEGLPGSNVSDPFVFAPNAWDWP